MLPADVTSSSTSAATPDATKTTATSSDPNDITQSLAFINLSRQLDASIPDSLASTQAAYDALLERKTPTPQDGQTDQDDDENNDDVDADEDDGLDERAILDLLNQMESADMAAQEFEGRLNKLLQGLDGMLESLGAAGQIGAADEGTTSSHSTAQDDVSPEPALG
ncbi:BZ3500_MvSof-1268-A1-R1_Chr3-2g06264 [Microbotryum saponariae]|uniref:BZ3500_MvSof-1268-A1-R1_Chr3-2g06264 protein n=1 Tax=Microbotryum saponariae TaxID=289078 RepID=A0A2X0LEM9_9BASI|nr:BZ3500_MvSof-1268-A1-R1_Chr3-2g06264 [Microbotryum saponariae]SDA04229.1 BZ3501_MvSof-1269-A2-R1_Chr3-2g05955 [Microbotryum saponariae]